MAGTQYPCGFQPGCSVFQKHNVKCCEKTTTTLCVFRAQPRPGAAPVFMRVRTESVSYYYYLSNKIRKKKMFIFVYPHTANQETESKKENMAIVACVFWAGPPCPTGRKPAWILALTWATRANFPHQFAGRLFSRVIAQTAYPCGFQPHNSFGLTSYNLVSVFARPPTFSYVFPNAARYTRADNRVSNRERTLR